MITDRLLDYLTRLNPTVRVESKGCTASTYNTHLTTRFRIQLDRLVTLPDVTRQCEEARFNTLYDETMLGHLVASSIMLSVLSALPPNLFLVAGGATWESDACVPDWGSKSKAILLGDTKYCYQESYYNNDVVSPIKQVQYYCAMYRC
ncbi:hypothetical protein BDW60DRAFT_220743 [Aspergillus nidulans var. acristatus]